MDPILLTVIILIVMVFLISFFVFLKTRKKKLTTKDIEMIRRELDKISSFSVEEKILKLDKLLDFALGKVGKNGSMHEKLKASERILSDINGVFKAHRLRNKIAHEVSLSISDQEFKYAFHAYMSAFKDLGIY